MATACRPMTKAAGIWIFPPPASCVLPPEVCLPSASCVLPPDLSCLLPPTAYVLLAMRLLYIGAGVPSDHTPVPIRNISIGSGLPLYDGASKSGDPGNGSDT